MKQYTQIFRKPFILVAPPWYRLWWANVQEYSGWYWLRRKLNNPHPWDPKA